MKNFNYCPNCTSANNEFKDNHRFECFDCGMVFYQNVASAVAVIIEKNNKILFTVRNQAPKKGMLDLPGGFTDPDESAENAACRELKEELNLDIQPENLRYLKSEPNSYVFKDVLYKTTDSIFCTTLPEQSHFELEKKEIQDIKWIEKSEIDLDKIGFDSLREAVAYYLKEKE